MPWLPDLVHTGVPIPLMRRRVPMDDPNRWYQKLTCIALPAGHAYRRSKTSPATLGLLVSVYM